MERKIGDVRTCRDKGKNRAIELGSTKMNCRRIYRLKEILYIVRYNRVDWNGLACYSREERATRIDHEAFDWWNELKS